MVLGGWGRALGSEKAEGRESSQKQMPQWLPDTWGPSCRASVLRPACPSPATSGLRVGNAPRGEDSCPAPKGLCWLWELSTCGLECPTSAGVGQEGSEKSQLFVYEQPPHIFPPKSPPDHLFLPLLLLGPSPSKQALQRCRRPENASQGIPRREDQGEKETLKEDFLIFAPKWTSTAQAVGAQGRGWFSKEGEKKVRETSWRKKCC